MNSKPNFFCFSHVPKTAGMTMRFVLAREFHNRLHETSAGFFEPKIEKFQIQTVLDRGTSIRCLAGHSVSADLPYDHTNYDVIGISIFREPSDRILSEFFYLKKLGYNQIKNKTLSDFLCEIQKEGPASYFWNTQSACLKIPIDVICERMKSGQLILIPQTRLEEGFLYLKYRFPNEFKDVSYVNQNSNRFRPRKVECPDWFKTQCLVKDYDLYNYASEIFESQISRTFGQDLDKKIRDLRRTCSVRKIFKEPIKASVRKMNSLLSRW